MRTSFATLKNSALIEKYQLSAFICSRLSMRTKCTACCCLLLPDEIHPIFLTSFPSCTEMHPESPLFEPPEGKVSSKP